MSWEDVRARWSSGWRTLASRASDLYERARRLDPAGLQARAQVFHDSLVAARSSLDRMASHLPDPPVTADDRRDVLRHQALEQRYRDLAAGFYVDATPMPDGGQPVVGVAPVVWVIAGFGVTAAGLAWAYAAAEYAANLRDQTALAEAELMARIEASRTGRPLQPSTLPAPPPPAADKAGIWLLGGLALITGAVTLPLLLRK